MANQGIYTDTRIIHGVQFYDVSGVALALSGTYSCSAYQRGNPVPVFVFNEADGTLDASLKNVGKLSLNAPSSQHQPELIAGLYRLHLKRVDSPDHYWAAEGEMLVGNPGDQETYIRFENASDGSTANSFAVAIAGPKGDPDATVAAELAAHLVATDPHDQYTLKTHRSYVAPAEFGSITGDASTTLQAMFNGFGTKYIDGLGKSYSFATPLTIPSSVFITNCTLTYTGTGTGITVNKSAHVIWRDVNLYSGGVNTTAVSEHTIVRQQGTSINDRAVGMSFYNCRLSGSGFYGLFAKWGRDYTFEHCSLDNIAYAAGGFVSCDLIRLRNNHVNMLDAVGTSSNAYGFYHTNDSAGYPADPNAGTPLAANPFCNDVIVEGNTVLGPKIWQAIDCHGAYNITIKDNRTFAAKYGISAPSGSGAAGDYAGWNNQVVDNIIDIRLPDGTASGVVGSQGININGGIVVPNRSIIVSRNTIIGYGAEGVAGSCSINATLGLNGVLIKDNIFDQWANVGIAMQSADADFDISGNLFHNHIGANADCIQVTGGVVNRGSISGNQSSSANANGVRVNVLAGSKIFAGFNMFDLCTLGWAFQTTASDAATHGPGKPAFFLITGVSGSVVIDLSILKIAPTVPALVAFTGLSGAVTDITFNNAANGNRVNITNDNATTVTFTRAAAALAGSVNAVLDANDWLEIERRTLWREVGRSANG